jgi:DNA-binding response OmpR family regulator
MPILIINQDIVFLEQLRTAFELQGYQVIATTSSVLAVSLFFQHRPRAVIVMVDMPYKDGFEITKEIRAFCQKTFILAVSANQNLLRAIKNLGANAVLPSSTEATAIVRAVKFL